MASPASPVLSAAQLATLAGIGEERTAAVGDVLFRVGDRRYPFIAILEGEVAIQDGAGNEIVRHGASGFLGEMNLLSGQTVFLTAVVTAADALHRRRPRRAAARCCSTTGRSATCCSSTFMRAARGCSSSARGSASRSSARARRTARGGSSSSRGATGIPYTWRDPEHPTTRRRPRWSRRSSPNELPLVRLPGGGELRGPSSGEVSRALGIGLELAVARGGRPPRRRRRAGRPRRRGLRRLGGPRHARRRGHARSAVRRATSRRIENYLGFPAGISGVELTSRAVTQARKFGARTATPYRARRLEPGPDRHVVRLEDDHEVAARAVVLATGADYRRLPVDGLEEYEGISVFYAAGPPEAQRCGAAASASSAAATRPRRPPSGSRAAARS